MEYFKKIEVFFLKKHLSSDSLKIISSVFLDFKKCFLKFAKHFIFIPKTLKNVFKSRNTFKNHYQTGSQIWERMDIGYFFTYHGIIL